MNLLAECKILRIASAYIAGMAISRQLESISSSPGYSLAITVSALAFLIMVLLQTALSGKLRYGTLEICCILAGAAVYVHRGPVYEVSLPAIGLPLMKGISATSLPKHADFINSILFGATNALDRELRTSFAKSGIIHVLSVSGLHVAFVAAFIDTFLRPLVKGRVFRVVIQIAAIGIYTLVCGAKPPVTRSAIMLGVALVSNLSGRSGQLISGIAFSAIIVASLDPNSVFTPSFQLSYATVFSLAYMGPIVKSLCSGYIKTYGNNALAFIVDSICLSLVATIGSAPLLAYYFGEISLVSPLANLAAVPLSGAIVILGLIQAVTFLVFPPAAMAFGATNGILVDLLAKSADTCSRLPFSQIVVQSPSVWSIFIFYFLVFWAAGRLTPGYFKDKIRRASIEVIIVAACTALMFCLVNVLSATVRVPSITLINVGQGDSTLVESSDGRRMLVDAGPITFYPYTRNAGERNVVPFLHKRGVRSLDAVLFTHPDSDHIGGGTYILGAIPVGAVIRSEFNTESPLSRELDEAIKNRGIKDLFVRKGDSIKLGKDVLIEVLSPDGIPDDDSENNNSIVLMVKAKGHKALLVGDIEADAENALVESGVELDCDILKVAHHGSKSSSTEGFLRAATPLVSVISVGRNNFGHPSAKVLSRLRSVGSQIRRTDAEGNITIEMPLGPLRVVSERNRRTATDENGRSLPMPWQERTPNQQQLHFQRLPVR